MDADASFVSVTSALGDDDDDDGDEGAFVVDDGAARDAQGGGVWDDGDDAFERCARSASQVLASTTADVCVKLQESQNMLASERVRSAEAAEAAMRAVEAMEVERVARLAVEARLRDVEAARDEAHARSRQTIDGLREELKSALKSVEAAGRASSEEEDATEYTLAEARASAAIAVKDLESTKREFQRQWEAREVDFETTVRELQDVIRDLSVRLDEAVEAGVEAALLERRMRQSAIATTNVERISDSDVATPQQTPLSPRVLANEQQENVVDASASLAMARVKDLERLLADERAERLELSSKIVDLTRGRREMARELVDACQGDVDADRAVAVARKHRADAEHLAHALSRRVAALERERRAPLERP